MVLEKEGWKDGEEIEEGQAGDTGSVGGTVGQHDVVPKPRKEEKQTNNQQKKTGSDKLDGLH